MMVWIQITSGRGPEECAWVVGRVLDRFQAQSKAHGLSVKVLEAAKGHYPETFKSVWLDLEGDKAETFARTWEGTVQWICRSMFRPAHKRKNWFVGVSVLKSVETLFVSGHDYHVETMRSSGPGASMPIKPNPVCGSPIFPQACPP